MRYNVIGGGDSALYGVEPASYYFRNGLLNLNVLLPLALVSPIFALLFQKPRPGASFHNNQKHFSFWQGL